MSKDTHAVRGTNLKVRDLNKDQARRIAEIINVLSKSSTEKFYSHLLWDAKVKISDMFPTAAITFEGRKPLIALNEEFFFNQARELKYQKSILKHELLHAILGHLSRQNVKFYQDTLGNADSQLMGIYAWSVDVCVHDRIGQEDFENLDNLLKNLYGPESGACHWKQLEGWDYSYGGRTTEWYFLKMLEQQKPPNESGEESGSEGDSGGPAGAGTGEETEGSGIPQPMDEHVIADVSDKIVDSALREWVHSAAQKSIGSIPSSIRGDIDLLLKTPAVPWDSILKNKLESRINQNKIVSKTRPNRRYSTVFTSDSDNIVMPGSKKQPTSRVVAVFDTSGSMSDDEISSCISVFRDLYERGTSCMVMFCDSAVADSCIFDLEDVDEAGFKNNFNKARQEMPRGGTSFVPPFKKVKELGENPDALVYFTDAEGYAPEKKPSYPVIWAVTKDGNQQSCRPYDCVWGERVRLPF